MCSVKTAIIDRDQGDCFSFGISRRFQTRCRLVLGISKASLLACSMRHVHVSGPWCVSLGLACVVFYFLLDGRMDGWDGWMPASTPLSFLIFDHDGVFILLFSPGKDTQCDLPDDGQQQADLISPFNC